MNNLGDALIRAFKARPTEVALADEAGALTGADLVACAEDVARSLAAEGVRTDEPVIVACSNRAADVAAFVGVWVAGAVAVPVHRQAPRTIVDRTLAQCGARVIVDDATATMPTDRLTIRPVAVPVRPLLDSAATIVFTSGSTGDPKGVVIAHDRLMAKIASIDEELEFAAGGHTYTSLQLIFIFGQWVTFLTLLKGGHVTLGNRFPAAEAASMFADRRIDCFAAVPTMLRAMVPHLAGAPPFAGQVMSGGEILPAGLSEQIRVAWPEVRLWDLYGLTETCGCDFIVRPGEQDAADGTIGNPWPGIDCRIHPETHELQIRTPYRMLGYLDRPDLAAEAFDGDWFRTGDMGARRSDGRITLTGRIKDLIIRAGNKIAPVEVERAVESHPDVAGALAVGLPDARTGEAIHLYVVLRPGAVLTAEAIRDWAGERLERYKVPDQIHFGASLPVGATGKTDRRALRKLLQG
ncbi:MAG: acyl--CoA ligase [Alphaproteobacteria bacterium]|nr:acyl--CoA ligase [Alphaproteobacteria bacterium]